MVIAGVLIAGGLYYAGIRVFDTYSSQNKELASHLVKRPKIKRAADYANKAKQAKQAHPNSSSTTNSERKYNEENTKNTKSNIQSDTKTQSAHYNAASSFVGDTRREQAKAYGGKVKPSQEKRINQRMRGVSIGMMGASLIGTTVFPPALLLLVPGFVYTATPIARTAVDGVAKRKRAVLEIIDLFFYTSTMLTGQYFLGSVNGWLYHLNRQFTLNTEDQSEQRILRVIENMPQKVWVLRGKVEINVPIQEVEALDVISVEAGQVVPVDGIVIEGFAVIDEQVLTGEARPVEKAEGMYCLASTLVIEGRVLIQVQQLGAETVASKVGSMLRQSLDYRDYVVAEAQREADATTLPLLALGALSIPIAGWKGATAVIGMSYGYNLRLINPLIAMSYLGLSAEENVLIKDGRVLDVLHKVDAIVFDKTGTLTLPKPVFQQVYTINNYSGDDLLRYAAATEVNQAHPIAAAIVEAAKLRDLEIPVIINSKISPGFGLWAELEGLGKQRVYLGSAKYMIEQSIELPEGFRETAIEIQNSGHALIYIAIGNTLEGAIELQTSLRPEAKEVVEKMQSNGLACYIVSGDLSEPTQQVADRLGIEHFQAEVLPEEKAIFIEKLQKEGKTVCFVGDGINDAVALKKADVSISLSGAAMMATDTAQIVMIEGTLSQLPFLFTIGKQYRSSYQLNFNVAAAISALTIGGILAFKWGVAAVMLANQLSLAQGIGQAFQPLAAYGTAIQMAAKKEKSDTNQSTTTDIILHSMNEAN